MIYFFNWRKITLQNFVVFCHASTRISHRWTHVPQAPSHIPPHPTLLDVTEPLFGSMSHTANSHSLPLHHKLKSRKLSATVPFWKIPKDQKESNSTQSMKLQAVYVVFHFAWKEKYPHLYCILIHDFDQWFGQLVKRLGRNMVGR